MTKNAIVPGIVQRLAVLFLFLAFSSAKAQVPSAAFSMDVQTGCAPLTVNFTNTSTGANSFAWTFGNTNSSSQTDPSSVYLAPGNYTVTLTATNTVNGLISTITQNVIVVNDPIAAFTASSVAQCEDINNICFTNTSANATTYTWDFGDGNTSTATNPCHTYFNPGTYTVKLVAFSPYGCSDLGTKINYITIYAKPAVSFSSNIQSTCNLTDVFNFTSSIPGATSWNWDFGDFTSSTSQSPSHNYSASGTYSVSLIATNTNGCTDTANYTNYINIGSTLVPSFTMTDTGGCAPFPVTFNCTVANATSWSWNFGDGNSSTQEDPAHTFSAPGNYNITLTVTTQSGCNGTVTYPGLIVVDNLPAPSFTVVQDTGCSPFNVQFNNTTTGGSTYSWNFGIVGGTSTQTNPSFIYANAFTYNVGLTAYSPNGCSNTTTYNNYITVYDPSATFTGSPLTGCPGVTVNFATSASQAGIVTWLWSFGDGTYSNLQNPSHSYSATGNYTVWLIVTNQFGCKDTVYKANYVRIYPSPIPYVLPDTLRICQNVQQTFPDPTLGSNSWNWNFGNGGTSTAQNPQYNYGTPGIYTVTLTAGMAGGCTQTFNPYAIVQVIPYSPQPIVANYINRCKPYRINFSTTTTNIVNYNWNFGDGTSSPFASPTHDFLLPGTYTVSLIVTIGSGCIDVISTTVTVGHINPIQFSGYNNCKGTPVQYIVQNSAQFTSWIWKFGDNTTSTLATVNHNYTNAGSYNVSLITTDSYGCIDTFTLAQPVVIFDPRANFTIAGNSTGCLSLPVQFQNTSTGASTYLWNFGDGTTDTTANPIHTYTTPGVYTVSLTATISICSNTKTTANLVTIISPQCNFTFATNTLCLPITATYTDLSPSAVSWLWDFGDGTTSTLQNPVHTFTAPPTGQVSLTIIDQFGCTETRSKTNISYYAAAASANVTTGCKPLSVTFTDQSGLATGWYWDFGNGNTSVLQNPVAIYNNDGLFNVMLIGTFPGGCTDTAYYPNMIAVNTPIADFIAPAASGCSPVTISFTNMSSDATDYLWDFGDGSTSTTINPTHIYNIPGFYDIMLVANNISGCSDTMYKPAYIAIPGAYSNFGLSATMGCEILSVQFTDSSINANTWSWNFGDGVSSGLPNPQHTYSDTGSYTVTLITQDTIGCTSIFTYPVPVQIFSNPIAQATTTDIEGCESYTSNFTNLSTNSNGAIWYFGNGDTSSITNPAYIYQTAGIYQPYIVANTIAGCRDTFHLPLITVHAVPQISYTPSAIAICNPDTITFTNTSVNLVNPQYNWVYGNGNAATTPDGGVMYTDSGTYAVTLYIVNTFGCNDSLTTIINVNPKPVAIASTADTTGCSPYTSTFTNGSLYTETYFWDFGDGNTSSLQLPVNTYATGGLYTPVLIASNHHGCYDTLSVNQVNVLQTPTAAFSADNLAVCSGTTVNYTSMSTDTINASYNWDFGFITATSPNTSIIYVNPGSYDVSLIVTNGNGCFDSTGATGYITVYDTIPPPVNTILSASVLNDNAVEITWENNTASDLGAYLLYRYDPLTTSYQLAYTDNNPVPISTGPTTVYQDTGLDTKNNSYTYILQAADRCDYRTPFATLTPHTTMNVTAVQAGTSIDVNWNAYGGCSVLWYQIDRTEIATGQTQQVALVSSSTLNYIDSTIFCPFDYSYRITALDLCGNTYFAYSDTSVARPANLLNGQHVDVMRSTVISNKHVLTEWAPPVLFPDRVQSYQILRSADGITYTPLAIVPAQVTSYVDYLVDVEEQTFFYKVVVINDCNLSGPEGFEGTSILMQGDWRNYSTKLNWTPYLKWDQGVDHYMIQKQNSFGVFQDYIQVDGNTTIIQLDE
ncbi:MAG: PKD domain-containing protein [Bacteroidota bacterium]